MQRDLFQIPAPSDTLASLHAAKGGVLERFRISLRLDHILVLFLGLIFLYAFIYSMGVERGKKIASQSIEMWQQKIKDALVTETVQKKTSMIDASKVPALPAPISTNKSSALAPQEATRSELSVSVSAPAVIATAVQPKPASASEVVVAKPADGKFTIQLVTLNSRELANDQINKLAKSGYKAFMIPSGKMIQICVNSFEKRAAALTFLKDLKQKGLAPSDAYIRNIPR